MTSRSLRSTILALFAVLGFTIVSQADDYPHLLFGNPSKATDDKKDKDNYLMKKEFFALSYNNSKGAPNWVRWQLAKEHMEGKVDRKQVFEADSELPKGFLRVTTKAYVGSGFDRGHMCPHADRDASREMSDATFVMTNIIPQAPNVNQKAWNELEFYSRNLVTRKKDRRLYIVSGPLGEGGTGKEGFKKHIGTKEEVTVPAECWKVILVVDGTDDPKQDLKQVTADTRVIAVLMPNDNESVGYEWAKYRTSIAQIQKATGLKFFDKLSPEIRKTFLEKVDETRIPKSSKSKKDD